MISFVSDFNAIADVSATLVEVLTKGLHVGFPNDAPKVLLRDLKDDPTENAITVFLYDVSEDASTRNRPATVRRENIGNSVNSVRSPMALSLRYLITPWSFATQGGVNEPRLNEHRYLGLVARLFYDKPIIAGIDLQGLGGLQGSSEALKVSLVPLPLEDRTRIWESGSKPYRLSLVYEVRVVNIDSTVTTPVALVGGSEIGFGTNEPGE